jgi:RNA polymerase sigma factor (sigma-70 family)
MSMAVETLNPEQKEIWFCHNNERMTQDEIAERLNLKRTTIETMLKRIQTKLEKHIRRNMGAYLLLKVEQVIMTEEDK